MSGIRQMVRKVTIIGAGMMASGIGVQCARSGLRVSLADIKKEALERSAEAVRVILRRLVKSKVLGNQEAEQALENMAWTTNIPEVLQDTDVVIESIPEVLELKQQVFRQLDELCPKQALLATNTSSLRISEIASTTTRSDSVVGLHWVNPPYLVPRVEVNRGEKTSDDTIRRARSFILQLRQIPVVTQKDVPGFVGARLRTVLAHEAMNLVEQGVISVEEVDNMVRFGLAIQLLPHGPLRAMDLMGPKALCVAQGDFMYSRTGEAKYQPPQLLREKAEEGELPWMPGEEKTARGWHDYTGEQSDAVIERRDMKIAQVVRLLEELGIIEQELQRIGASVAAETV